MYILNIERKQEEEFFVTVVQKCYTQKRQYFSNNLIYVQCK